MLFMLFNSLFLCGVKNDDLNSSEQKIDSHKKMFSPDISGQITASIINGILYLFFSIH